MAKRIDNLAVTRLNFLKFVVCFIIGYFVKWLYHKSSVKKHSNRKNNEMKLKNYPEYLQKLIEEKEKVANSERREIELATLKEIADDYQQSGYLPHLIMRIDLLDEISDISSDDIWRLVNGFQCDLECAVDCLEEMRDELEALIQRNQDKLIVVPT